MDKTVTRAVLGEHAARMAGVPRAEAMRVSERMFEILAEALKAGETVKLTGFGSLQIRLRAERTGRNPRTGEVHRIIPHRAVTFVAGGRLRTALADSPTPQK